jgi:hypothetical protein
MAISRSKNSQNWRRQLQSLRRSSSPFLYLPRSLAGCARVCSADDNDDAAARESGPQKGEGRQGEGEENRRRITRRGSQQGFFWVLCNEVIRALEPYLILKTPSACICFEQLDPFVSCFCFLFLVPPTCCVLLG